MNWKLQTRYKILFNLKRQFCWVTECSIQLGCYFACSLAVSDYRIEEGIWSMEMAGWNWIHRWSHTVRQVTTVTVFFCFMLRRDMDIPLEVVHATFIITSYVSLTVGFHRNGVVINYNYCQYCLYFFPFFFKQFIDYLILCFITKSILVF